MRLIVVPPPDGSGTHRRDGEGHGRVDGGAFGVESAEFVLPRSSRSGNKHVGWCYECWRSEKFGNRHAGRCYRRPTGGTME